MNIEGLDDDDDDDEVATQFVHSAQLGALERQVYGHVLAAVDLDALSNLEQLTTMLVIQHLDRDRDARRKRAMSDTPPKLTPLDRVAMDLASQLIDGALRRVIEDPRRYMSCGPPPGVTPEEAAAVAFDEDCPYCVAERKAQEAARAYAEAHPSDEEEVCPCCDMLVEEWREEHKEVLAKAGLADVKHEHAGARKRGTRIEVS